MSLTALNWRKLPVRTVSGSATVSNVLNNIYDVLTGSLYHDGSPRVPGSASAWQNVGRFITGSGTGSNTEAVYCYPPTKTVMSQSVIIAGANSAGARTNNQIPRPSNQATISPGDISIACVRNAGVFSSWATASNGFGQGSSLVNYSPFISGSGANVTPSKIFIYESQETIAIFIGASTGITYGAIAGAIIDPEQTVTSVDAEADNRVYGYITSVANYDTGNNPYGGLGQDFLDYRASLTTLVGFLSTQGFDFGNYTPCSFIVLTPSATVDYMTSTALKIGGQSSTFTTLSSKFIKHNLNVKADSSGQYLGRLREITVVRPFAHNLVLKDASGNILGFSISNSETDGTLDTIMLNY